MRLIMAQVISLGNSWSKQKKLLNNWSEKNQKRTQRHSGLTFAEVVSDQDREQIERC